MLVMTAHCVNLSGAGIFNLVLTRFNKSPALLYFFLTFGLAAILIFFKFNKPNLSFWDESYYVPTAEKYLSNIYFADVHPPLGKLLIAAGEMLLRKNIHLDKSGLIATDKMENVPPGFSFAGYRLFPALCGVGIPVFLFLFLLGLTGRPFVAFVGTCPILFDTAFTLSARGALLDAPQLFFFTVSLWCFSYALKKEAGSWFWFLWGAVIAACTMVRINGLILLFFPFVLGIYLFQLRPENERPQTVSTQPQLKGRWSLQSLRRRYLAGMAGFIFLSFLVYYLHFVLVERIPGINPPVRYATLSLPKQAILFPGILAAQFARQSEQNDGVPDMNRFSPSENASRAWGWPFGVRSIHYRWDKTGTGQVKYLTLIFNPLSLVLALCGVLWGSLFLFVRFLYQIKIPSRHGFALGVLWFSFFSYMGIMAGADRVLYLYHYFPPLILGVSSFFLLMDDFFLDLKMKNRLLTGLMIALVIGFIYYLPFVYHFPLNSMDVTHRSWFEFWELQPVH